MGLYAAIARQKKSAEAPPTRMYSNVKMKHSVGIVVWARANQLELLDSIMTELVKTRGPSLRIVISIVKLPSGPTRANSDNMRISRTCASTSNLLAESFDNLEETSGSRKGCRSGQGSIQDGCRRQLHVSQASPIP